MLINRQCQIPNGNNFYDPVTKFSAPPFTSFRAICEGWAIAIRGNLILAKSRGLPTTMPEIERRVDEYLTAICLKNGWTRFVQEAASSQPPFRRRNPQPLPKSKLPIFQSVAKVAAGARTLIDWITTGAEAVPQEQANTRAAVCAACPVNSLNSPDADKPLSHWFTVPAAFAIKAALSARDEWGLQTPEDIKLGLCLSCQCPMKLKVHVPLDKFYGKMTEESKNGLHESCWIRKELATKLLGSVSEGLAKQ